MSLLIYFYDDSHAQFTSFTTQNVRSVWVEATRISLNRADSGDSWSFRVNSSKWLSPWYFFTAVLRWDNGSALVNNLLSLCHSLPGMEINSGYGVSWAPWESYLASHNTIGPANTLINYACWKHGKIKENSQPVIYKLSPSYQLERHLCVW